MEELKDIERILEIKIKRWDGEVNENTDSEMEERFGDDYTGYGLPVILTPEENEEGICSVASDVDTCFNHLEDYGGNFILDYASSVRECVTLAEAEETYGEGCADEFEAEGVIDAVHFLQMYCSSIECQNDAMSSWECYARALVRLDWDGNVSYVIVDSRGNVEDEVSLEDDEYAEFKVDYPVSYLEKWGEQ